MSASWALQQAIYAALVASGEIKDVVGDPPRVFDAVPRDTAFPYIVVGDGSESDWSTASDKGSEHRIEVHAWSRAAGHRETKLVAEAVRDALDLAELDVAGQALVDIRYLSTDFTRDADGETYRAVVRFRAAMEEGE